MKGLYSYGSQSINSNTILSNMHLIVNCPRYKIHLKCAYDTALRYHLLFRLDYCTRITGTERITSSDFSLWRVCIRLSKVNYQHPAVTCQHSENYPVGRTF